MSTFYHPHTIITMNIVFTTRLPHEGFSRLDSHKLIMPLADTFTHSQLCEHLSDADILVATYDYAVPMQILQSAHKLRMIAAFGAGFNNIPIEWCRQHGVIVTNTPTVVVEPTAEQCFALMHAVVHRTAELDRRLRMADFDGIRFGVMHNLGRSLYGMILGIIGMGKIGQAVARRAVAAGMTIIYHNRHQLDADIEKRYHARYVSFDELLRTSDMVSLNLPYTPEVHHLIDTAELHTMKSNAFLINTARGAHVNEKALAQALLKGEIAGAGLDVFENEPQITPELLQCPNVVLSPHIGTGTWEGRLATCRSVEENIFALLCGNHNLPNRVV